MTEPATARLAVPKTDVRSIHLKIAPGIVLPNEQALQIAVEIRLPPKTGSLPVALVCLPGGGMNRRFYDLQAEGDDSFSFADHMAKQGFIVVMIDTLGIGESTRPVDGYALTAELLAEANANVTRQLLDDLRSGAIDGQPRPGLASIGVGHSMGALLTVLQQSKYRQHAALVLLGFATRGLPEYLQPEARELAIDTLKVRAELVRLARDMFVVPYPRITRGPRGGDKDLYGSGNVEGRGVDALKAAIEPILPVPAYMSMLPGNVAPEAAQIDVPVFLGVGDKDMVGSPHQIPAAFSASPDVTLHILKETGHSHFLFPSRTGLFERLGAWARCIVKSEK
jgi:pimeloyl-ACP methyl ester carboxylesterase